MADDAPESKSESSGQVGFKPPPGLRYRFSLIDGASRVTAPEHPAAMPVIGFQPEVVEIVR